MDFPKINSKTSDPSNIDISVYLMYKIKPESIVALYLDYPSANHHKDMALTGKVIKFLIDNPLTLGFNIKSCQPIHK